MPRCCRFASSLIAHTIVLAAQAQSEPDAAYCFWCLCCLLGAVLGSWAGFVSPSTTESDQVEASDGWDQSEASDRTSATPLPATSWEFG